MSNPNQPSDKWQKFAEQAANQNSEEETTQPSDELKAEEQLGFTTRQQFEEQLTAMEMQFNEAKNQLFRAQAELENVRRRAEREISNAHKYGVGELLTALLPVIDGLVRGLESADSSDPKVKPLHAGMQMTLDLLHKALVRFGLEIIDPAPGDNFDPKLHEAMSMQSHPGAKSNSIVNVLQKGYQLHGRVLRPAMVIVAA